MNEYILKIELIIICCGKSNIRLLPKPDFEWIQIGYKNPDSDIKFSVLNNERILNVFLHDPLSSCWSDWCNSIVNNFIQVWKYSNPSSSWKSCWFGNPNILLPIHIKLRKSLSHLIDDILNLFLLWFLLRSQDDFADLTCWCVWFWFCCNFKLSAFKFLYWMLLKNVIDRSLDM